MDLTRTEAALTHGLSPAVRGALELLHDRWIVDADHPATVELGILTNDPGYLAAAQSLLGAAAERARAIQKGRIPFAADHAFTPEEAKVVGTAAAVALTADVDWAALSFELLHDSAVAPSSGKAVPSQAMSFAIARAILTAPTPDAVAALDSVRSATTHGSIAKRFTKYMPAARRALASRPEVALRVPATPALSAKELKRWSQILESSWIAGASWPAAAWHAIVSAQSAISDMSARLIWTTDTGEAFRMVDGTPSTSTGAPTAIPESARISLWHPVTAAAPERQAWENTLVEHAIEQPFAQVKREFYTVDSIARIAPTNTVVDLKKIVGIGRGQGWKTGETLTRMAGDTLAELTLEGRVYPGCVGTSAVHGLRIGTTSRVPSRWGGRDEFVFLDSPPPPIPTSELLRSADLLISTSAVTR